jgi:peroxiredoxin
VVLGVNTADVKEAVVEILEQNRVEFPNILDTTLEAQMTLMKYETVGASAVPMTYLIDREGKVMNAWYGYDKKKAQEAVKELKLDEP